jgi:tRNA A-37 threonylcarbamoyl transferase component Bud32
VAVTLAVGLMSGWYVKVEGTGPLGPLPTEQVTRGVASGDLRQDVLVCRVGGDTWHPLRSFPEFGDPNVPPPPADSQVAVNGPDGEEAPELASGRELGNYRISHRIGSGGMGEVYEAVHVKLRKRVALKTLRRALARSGEARARFLREGETASSLRHPHVVDITDVGEADGIPFLVMELLEGEPLSALLRRVGSLSVQAAVDIMLPVIDAVAAAHENGIVHRDLKPDNIFLAQSHLSGPLPKVLDFGISKVLSGANVPNLTATSSFLGTPFYMSPEQALGAKDIDGRSDQYSLAVVLYEALTGQQPHASRGDSLMQLVHAIARGEFPTPRSLRPDLPPQLEGIMLRAMNLQPLGRFDSMRQWGAALVPFASDRGRSIWGGVLQASPQPAASVSARAPAAAAPHGMPASASTLEHGNTAITAEPAALSPRRTGLIPIIAGLLMLGVFGLAVWKLTSGGDGGPAGSSQDAGSFKVSVKATPETAKIELDGSVVGTGSFERDLPRDGKRHVLTVAADGFVSQTMVFKDEAPPSSVALAAVPKPASEPSASAIAPPVVAAPQRKVGVGSRQEPAPPAGKASAPRGRRTDNIDPWEK